MAFLAGALSAAGQGLTSSGRPLVNLSFAVNFALTGNAVRSYHVLNLCVHSLAGLTLFGILRRTLEALGIGSRSSLLALGISLIWTLHPLQTEAVTYIVQRAESMMGVFYLQTLYWFIRYAGAPGRRQYGVLSFLACLLGMATKEVMVSAPLMVLLYDRAFVSGSFRESWRRHGLVHLPSAPPGFFSALRSS